MEIDYRRYYRLTYFDGSMPPRQSPPGWTREETGRAWSLIPDKFKVERIPALVGPDGVAVEPLVGYLTDRMALSNDSKDTYFKEFRTYFNWLHNYKYGLAWDEVTKDDLEDFGDYRCRKTELPMSESLHPGQWTASKGKWNQALAILTDFYKWAVAEQRISASPVPSKVSVNRFTGEIQESPVMRRKGSRNSNVKHKTRAAVERFISMGMVGLDRDGLSRSNDRLAFASRNSAHAGMLFNSGLRSKECAGLLTIDIPEDTPRSWVPDRLAKGDRGRTYFLAEDARRSVWDYIRMERALIVQEAREKGHYKRDDLVIVEDFRDATTSDAEVKIKGIWARLSNMDLGARKRLMRMTNDGLEPMALWLNSPSYGGLMVSRARWNAIYQKASERCQDSGYDVVVKPHWLRHSYAIFRVITSQKAFLKYGMSANEQLNFQDVFGDVWDLVAFLLGHQDKRTTQSIYAAPIMSLNVAEIVSEQDVQDTEELFKVDGLMSEFARQSDGIQDV